MDLITVTCPACWQKQDLQAEDPGRGEVELITDCEVCCRPMRVRFWRGMDREVEAEVGPGNE